jgi:hypothetical protein
MRFHLGSIPDSPDFVPDDSWKQFIEDEKLSIWQWQLKALPLAILNLIIVTILWIVFTDFEKFILDITFPLPILKSLFTLMCVLIVHEFLHAICFPEALRSSQVIIGFWPAQMLVYTKYIGAVKRNRFLIFLSIPFFVISILPIIFASISKTTNLWMTYISILNAFLASGDVLTIFEIFKLSSGTELRTHGTKLFWREDFKN